MTEEGRNPGEQVRQHVIPEAEQVIGDIDAMEASRNLAAYERQARLVAREYLALAALVERQRVTIEALELMDMRASFDFMRSERRRLKTQLRERDAENERLRGELADASIALDEAGCQVAASQAHRAAEERA